MKSMGSFTGQQAPCGRIVGGNKYEDQDEDVLVTQELDLRLRVPFHPA